MAADAWSPQQYERFRAVREQPFWDLLHLVDVPPDGRAVDLGCGTGVLTRELHRAVHASDTVGVDTSDAMLARAAEIDEPGLRFVKGDIGTWSPAAPCDVVLSSAALQWLDDHPRLFERLSGFLAPDGVLAVQCRATTTTRRTPSPPRSPWRSRSPPRPADTRANRPCWRQRRTPSCCMRSGSATCTYACRCAPVGPLRVRMLRQ